MSLAKRIDALEQRVGIAAQPSGPFDPDAKAPFDYEAYVAAVAELWPMIGPVDDGEATSWGC